MDRLNESYFKVGPPPIHKMDILIFQAFSCLAASHFEALLIIARCS